MKEGLLSFFTGFSNKAKKPETLYTRAKLIFKYLFAFPYINPSDIDSVINEDKALVDIILLGYKTTIDDNNKTCQSTLDPLDRIKYQKEFKDRIIALLDECLLLEPDFAPAMLLYVRTAEWNTRAADRMQLITVYEKFLGAIETSTAGARAYDLMAADIKGCFGNEYDRVERYLSDFHYELGKLYLKEKRFEESIKNLKKAEQLTPSVYAGTAVDAYIKKKDYRKALLELEEALKLPLKRIRKDLLKERIKDIKFLLKEQGG